MSVHAASGLAPGTSHTLIFYGGLWEGGAGGTVMTAMDGDGHPRESQKAWESLTGSTDFESKQRFNPDLRDGINSQAVIAGTQWLAPQDGVHQFDPRGKLIVYGYSAGGFNAMNLCRRIKRYFGWYDLQLNRLGNIPSALQGDPRFAEVVIDLLITVDACRKDARRNNKVMTAEAMAAGASTSRPSGVLRHVNYYERVDREYWGVSITDADVDDPQTVNATHAHDLMPRHTLELVKSEIGNVL
jgi:hypothetical protein